MSDVEQGRRCVQLMVIAAWADGHVEGTEAIAIQKLVQGLPELAGVGPISEIAREARQLLQDQGMEACLIGAASALHDRSMKELAFQCCARVMGSDSVFASEEQDFLRKLQQLFSFSVDDIRRLLVLAAPGMHGGPPIR
jgi:prepilin-type processing-associated H-X9-DG protein